LQEGQTLPLVGVEQGNIGAKAGRMRGEVQDEKA
jgi:hypothetical protein